MCYPLDCVYTLCDHFDHELVICKNYRKHYPACTAPLQQETYHGVCDMCEGVQKTIYPWPRKNQPWEWKFEKAAQNAANALGERAFMGAWAERRIRRAAEYRRLERERFMKDVPWDEKVEEREQAQATHSRMDEGH